MYVKLTSAAAFHKITKDGLVGRMQQMVWLKLYEDGPMTGRELDSSMGISGAKRRLSELRRLGLVIERPARLCRIGKRSAIVWMAVTGTPVKPPEPELCPTCHRPIRRAR